MSDEPLPPPPTSSWRGYLILGIVALVLVAGVVGFVVFGMDDSSLLPAQYNGFDKQR